MVGLDGSQIDARSDLDCAGNSTTIHLVGTGMNGEYWDAVGFGTSYNPFKRQLASATLNPGAAVAFEPSKYIVAGVDLFGLEISWVSGATSTAFPGLTNNDANSPVDIAWQGGFSSFTTYIAGVNTSNVLEINQYREAGDSSAGWQPTILLNPPAGKTFSFSPTICADSGEGGGNGAYAKHLAVVAGGSLWYAKGDSSFPLVFGAWEQVDTGVTSAPDCTVLNDSTVHIVALHAGGTLTDAYGSSGSWTKKDLGTF